MEPDKNTLKINCFGRKYQFCCPSYVFASEKLMYDMLHNAFAIARLISNGACLTIFRKLIFSGDEVEIHLFKFIHPT